MIYFTERCKIYKTRYKDILFKVDREAYDAIKHFYCYNYCINTVLGI